MYVLSYTHLFTRAVILCSLVLCAGDVFADQCTTYACTENSRLTSELKKADHQLNIKYKYLIQNLNGKQKILLVQEQKKWIIFRDNKCEKFADDECHDCDFSNSAQIQKHANDELWCVAQLTKKRTHELTAITLRVVNGVESDFSFNPAAPELNR